MLTAMLHLRASLPGVPVGGRFALEDGQASVVVRKLVKVRERDLAGQVPVVPGDIRPRVYEPVFELDIQPHPELLEVAPEHLEVDPEFSRDGERLFARERFLDSSPRSCTAMSSGRCFVTDTPQS